jgi:hypothetical protein
MYIWNNGTASTVTATTTKAGSVITIGDIETNDVGVHGLAFNSAGDIRFLANSGSYYVASRQPLALSFTAAGSIDMSAGNYRLNTFGGALTLTADKVLVGYAGNQLGSTGAATGILTIRPKTASTPICINNAACASAGISLSDFVFERVIDSTWGGVQIGSTVATGGIVVNSLSHTAAQNNLYANNALYFAQSTGTGTALGGNITLYGILSNPLNGVNAAYNQNNNTVNGSYPGVTTSFVATTAYGFGVYLASSGSFNLGGVINSNERIVVSAPMNVVGAITELNVVKAWNSINNYWDVALLGGSVINTSGGNASLTLTGGRIATANSTIINSPVGTFNLSLSAWGTGATSGVVLGSSNTLNAIKHAMRS